MFKVVTAYPIIDQFDAIRGTRFVTVKEFALLTDAVDCLDEQGNRYGEDDYYGPDCPTSYITRDGYTYFGDWFPFAPDTTPCTDCGQYPCNVWECVPF